MLHILATFISLYKAGKHGPWYRWRRWQRRCGIRKQHANMDFVGAVAAVRHLITIIIRVMMIFVSPLHTQTTHSFSDNNHKLHQKNWSHLAENKSLLGKVYYAMSIHVHVCMLAGTFFLQIR